MRIMRYLLDLLDLWYGILGYLLDLWFGWEDLWDYYDICDLYGINYGITMGFVICIGYGIIVGLLCFVRISKGNYPQFIAHSQNWMMGKCTGTPYMSG